MATENAKIVISAEDKASGSADKIKSKFESLSDSFKKVGTVVSGFGAAGVLALKGFIDSAIESQTVTAQLNAVLKSTGGAAGLFAKDIQDQAQALQSLTTYSDEAIGSAQNLMLTFTNVKGPVFQDSIGVILDMSTALGQDLKSSSIQLGKALQDPINGITALSRVGVNFTDKQKDMITKMVESGKVMEAQKLILGELKTEFGGSAEAAAQTFGGSIEQLKNRFDNLKETIGFMLLPILQSLTKLIGGAITIFEKLPDPIKRIIAVTALLATGLAVVAGPILLFIGFLPSLAAGFEAVGISISGAIWPVTLIIAALAALYLAWTNNFLGIRDIVGQAITFISEQFALFSDEIMGIIDLIVETFTKISEDWAAFMLVYGEQVRGGLELIKTIFSGAWEFIKLNFALFWDSIKLIFTVAWDILSGMIKVGLNLLKGDWSGAWEAYKKIYTDVWDAIKKYAVDVLDSVGGFVMNFIQKVKDAIGFMKELLGMGSPDTPMGSGGRAVIGNISAAAKSAPRKAKGGPVSGGASYLVGEKGPEMFTPSSSGNITPNNKMGGITIIINGNVSSKEIAEEYGDMIVQRLKLHSAIV